MGIRGGATLGLKFKTESRAGGEMYSGDDGLEISEVVPGHAAEKSGEICVGDTIIKINSERVCGVPMSKVRRILRGAETFKITLRKASSSGSAACGGKALPKPESIEGCDPEMAKIILSEVSIYSYLLGLFDDESLLCLFVPKQFLSLSR